jgi:hypothetical protein
MSNVETVGDANNPVSVLTQTLNGRVIDMSNLPGAVKIKMIQEGEMGVDAFATPPNMPGHKLRKIREAHRAAMEVVLSKNKEEEDELSEEEKAELEKAEKINWEVGDYVTFQDKVYEVLKTRSDAVLIEIPNKKGKMSKTWVHRAKVTKG